MGYPVKCNTLPEGVPEGKAQVNSCNKPILMKPFKYEDHEDEGAMWATIASMTYFGINIHIPFKDFKLHVRSSLQQGVPG